MNYMTITTNDMLRCPKRILLAAHYRADGLCRCDGRVIAADALAKATADLANALQAVGDAQIAVAQAQQHEREVST